MSPIEFEGCNVVYAKYQPEYLSLPAKIDPEGNVTTCWELSDEEIKLLIETKKLFIDMMTFNKPLMPIRPYVI